MNLAKTHLSEQLKRQNMKFNICNVGTKEWIDFKADISFGLYASLLELGHDTSISVNNFYLDRLNIIIGADFLAGNVENIRHLLKSKVEYVIFEVEHFDGFTVNSREQFNIEDYKLLIENAKFVITPYLANVESYNQHIGDGKARYARWGYHEKMTNDKIIRRSEFEFDALFFGMLKGDRANKMRALTNGQNYTVKLLAQNDPLMFKDYFVSRCRWGLNLSYGEREKFVNPFRLYYMAANGMPILADGGIDADDYLNLCEVVNFSDFPKTLESRTFNAKYLEERYRASNLTKNLKAVL